MYFSHILLLLAIFSKAEVFSNAEKVKLGVYYETLCPDSMKFVTGQFYPTYLAIKNIVDPMLVPFGKASFSYDEQNKQYSFNCHHGPRECKANILQSCVLALINDTDIALKLINCMELDQMPDTSLAKCAIVAGITDVAMVESCANGPDGAEYLAENGRKTLGLEPKVTFVPWITVNGNHTDEMQNLGLNNLKKLLCDTYEDLDKPEACN